MDTSRSPNLTTETTRLPSGRSSSLDVGGLVDVLDPVAGIDLGAPEEGAVLGSCIWVVELQLLIRSDWYVLPCGSYSISAGTGAQPPDQLGMVCRSAIIGGVSRTLTSTCPNQTSFSEVVVMVWVLPWVEGGGACLTTPVSSIWRPVGRAGDRYRRGAVPRRGARRWTRLISNVSSDRP